MISINFVFQKRLIVGNIIILIHQDKKSSLIFYLINLINIEL